MDVRRAGGQVNAAALLDSAVVSGRSIAVVVYLPERSFHAL
jgi:hypothetical protein